MKIPLFLVVAVVTIVSVAVIYGLMSALQPGGPATSTTYTPYTTPTSPHATTPMTTPLTSTTYTPYTTTPPPEEKYIEAFEEFINLVRYMKWRLKDYDRVDNELKIEIFYYHNKGVEVVGGVEYTRIEFIIEEESGNTTVIIWLPK
ncbi:MAG: hypothetical protein QXV72_05600, partial [Sulfolobales archaeon]